MEGKKIVVMLNDGHIFKFLRARVEENDKELRIVKESGTYTFRKKDIKRWINGANEIDNA